MHFFAVVRDLHLKNKMPFAKDDVKLTGLISNRLDISDNFPLSVYNSLLMI